MEIKNQLKTALSNLSEQQWKDIDDAYGSYKPEFYIKMGFPEEFVNSCIETFTSDGTYQGSLWKDLTRLLRF